MYFSFQEFVGLLESIGMMSSISFRKLSVHFLTLMSYFILFYSFLRCYSTYVRPLHHVFCSVLKVARFFALLPRKGWNLSLPTLPTWNLYLLYDLIWLRVLYPCSFPGESVVNNPPDNSGDAGSVPGMGRSPREGNGNPL